jgi:DNA-binding LacI/PurR family transcriptional regulator/DNA-binding transcriptional regulator YhcF (GntR family)
MTAIKTTLEKPDDGSRGDTLYKAVVDNLRLQIDEGAVGPGEKLPSINALCLQYGVSTITVRAAIRELTTAGYLESRPRSGIFVRARKEEKRSGLIREAIAILTPFTGAMSASHRQTGWLEYLTQGAMNEIRNCGLHALTLHPDGLTGQTLEDFVADNPRVIVVSNPARPGEIPYGIKLIESAHRTDMRMVIYGSGPDLTMLAMYDRVISDHQLGAYELARLLIQRGHKRIVKMWPIHPSGYWFQQRYLGYERAMKEAGLGALPPLQCLETASQVNEKETEAEFWRHTRLLAGNLIELMTGAQAPDAIMVHCDADYHYVAAACRIFGREPGRDIEIVGYDNMWADLKQYEWEPSAPLATVDKRNYECGQELVRLLLARDAGALPVEPRCNLVAPEMIVVATG